MTNAELARRCACSFMEAESAKEREVADAARCRRLAAMRLPLNVKPKTRLDAEIDCESATRRGSHLGGAVVGARAMKLYRCELTGNAAVYVLAESEEQAMRAALCEEFDHEFPGVTAAEVCTLSRLHKHDHTCIPAGENPNCLTIAEHFGVDD